MPFGIGKSKPKRSKSTRSSRSGGTRASLKKQGTVVGTFALAFVRLLQLVAAIVVLGYYGAQLGKSHNNKAAKYNGTSFVSCLLVPRDPLVDSSYQDGCLDAQNETNSRLIDVCCCRRRDGSNNSTLLHDHIFLRTVLCRGGAIRLGVVSSSSMGRGDWGDGQQVLPQQSWRGP